jgi:hypothetical protein
MPAAQPAKSPGTPPGDDDHDAPAAHPGQGGSRQPALPAGQQPSRGALATGHAGPRRAPTPAVCDIRTEEIGNDRVSFPIIIMGNQIA